LKMTEAELDDEQAMYELLETSDLPNREYNPYTDCRMYENEFPEVDDLVMVRVTRVTEIGAYVNMLEYNNKEGIILLSNLSRKRIRSVNRHVRVGKIEVLQVLRVDTDKGYVDLSKKSLFKRMTSTNAKRDLKNQRLFTVSSVESLKTILSHFFNFTKKLGGHCRKSMVMLSQPFNKWCKTRPFLINVISLMK